MAYHNRETFYKSKEWRAFRKVIINERGLTDEITGEEIVGDPVLHHKIELTDKNVLDSNIALNPDNVIIVSIATHNKIHNRYHNNMKPDYKVYIVYGSPRAGKNTLVESIADDSDLIVDIDNIWNALCLGGRSSKPNRVKGNVFELHKQLLEQVRKRKGFWRKAFIIGGYPNSLERKQLADRLKAEEIFVDTPIEVCLSRCQTDEERQWVMEWFERHDE